MIKYVHPKHTHTPSPPPPHKKTTHTSHTRTHLAVVLVGVLVQAVQHELHQVVQVGARGVEARHVRLEEVRVAAGAVGVLFLWGGGMGMEREG